MTGPDYDADAGVYPEGGISASFPEETSPLRKATRPVVTRKRSSSTAVSRTFSAPDVALASMRDLHLGIPKRNRMPDDWRPDPRDNFEDEDDLLDARRERQRSESRSPQLRVSLEGYSSRSSSSPSTQPSSSTSPELAPRRQFKRSVTVPSRPRIPGAWGDASDKALSRDVPPLDSVLESEATANSSGHNRFTTSTTRRPYVTPVTNFRTYRGAAPSQPQSLASNRFHSSNQPIDSVSPSTNSSPESDAPLPSRTPHTSQQSRVMNLGVPSTHSRPGSSHRPGTADSLSREISPVGTTHLHSSGESIEPEGEARDTSRQFDRELAALQLMILSDDEDGGPSSPHETAVQRPSKRKGPEEDRSHPGSPESFPSAPPPSSPPLLSVPPIPPYRGPRSVSITQRPDLAGHERPSHPPRVIQSNGPQRQPIEPLAAHPVSRMNHLLAHGRSTVDLRPGAGASQELIERQDKPVSDIARHRRSPTAPSPQTSATIASAVTSEGKENRATNGLTWGGDVAAAREREHYAHAALEREIPVPPLPSSSRAMSDKDRLYAQRWDRQAEVMGREDQDRQRQPSHEQRLQEDVEQEPSEQEDAYLAEQQALAARNAAEAKASSGTKEVRTSRSHAQVSANRPAPPPPTSASDHRSLAPTSHGKKMIYVRKKAYTKLTCVGRGGSSRVYRVLDENNEIFAIKRVTLERADAETIQGYQNEIQLLTRLSGQPGIIKLIDFESSIKKNTIMLVLECGEIDFAALIAQRVAEKFYQPEVAVAWRQMLQAVHVIHEEKIVHSDLKPANFVLVRGALKLIDFGIAKAIANDTTNIQREQQIGTVNYMSPEAIEETRRSDGKRVMKLGRASDVWSLGCILYQMVYGRPPFHSLSLYPKMKAIPDPNYVIDFPEYTVPLKLGSADKPDTRLEHLASKLSPDLINSMKMCLIRDPKKRGTIPELLAQSWVEGISDVAALTALPSTPPVKGPILKEDESIMTQKNMLQLIRYMRTLEGMSPENDEQMSKELFMNLKQVARQV